MAMTNSELKLIAPALWFALCFVLSVTGWVGVWWTWGYPFESAKNRDLVPLCLAVFALFPTVGGVANINTITKLALAPETPAGDEEWRRDD